MSRHSIFELDTLLLQSNLSWEDAKSMLRTTGENGRIQETGLTITNHLLYIRALSRVLVDVETYDWNRHKPPALQIELVVAGTNNLTSDYDVTMVGPQASVLSTTIMAKFHAETGKDLAVYADTNLYCLPFVKLHATQQQTPWFMAQFRSIGLPGLFLPFPITHTFRHEEQRIALLRYRGQRDPVPTAGVPVLATAIESLIYTEQWYALQCVCQLNQLGKVLHQIQQQQPGAYWTLSSMLVVVVEMQRGVAELHLTPETYRVCALENAACIQEHRTAYTDVLKYVYRVLYCWDKCAYHYLDDVLTEQQHLATIHRLMQQRGMVDFVSNPDFTAFYTVFLPWLLPLLDTFSNMW